jgi:hypothetical protein
MNGNRMCSEAYPCGDNGCADVVIAKGWTVLNITVSLTTIQICGQGYNVLDIRINFKFLARCFYVYPCTACFRFLGRHFS